jgi:hypothetical protein
VAGIGDMITGKGARRQAALAEAAQAEQKRLADEEAADLDALLKGQEQNAQVGGGGLLAFVDDRLKGTLG